MILWSIFLGYISVKNKKDLQLESFYIRPSIGF